MDFSLAWMSRLKRPANQNRPASGLVLASGIVLASASGYPIGSLGVSAASPFLLTAVRITIAALVLTAMALASRARWPHGWMLLHCVIVGVLGHCVHFAGLYAGLAAGVPASVSALVFGLNPLVTVTIAAIMLGERLTRRRLLALLVGIAAVISALGSRVVASGGVDAGSALTLLGLLGLASSTVWQQRFCVGIDLRTASAVQLLASVPPLTALAFIEQGAVSDVRTTVVVILWLVVVNSVLGTRMLLASITRLGAVSTSTVFCVVPSMATIMAWPIVGQVPSSGAVLGLLLGAIACALGLGSPSRSTTTATAPTVAAGGMR